MGLCGIPASVDFAAALSSCQTTVNSNTAFGKVKTADLAACSVRRGRGFCFT
jgi:hypothetical protein